MDSKHFVVLLLRDPLRAAELAEVLMPESIEAVVAQGADELYRFVNQQRIDLVIVENELEGFLTGIEIIERLYTDLVRPTTFLLCRRGDQLQERIAAMRIEHVLPPESTTADLASTVKDTLLAKKHAGIQIPSLARKLVQQADDIRPMPQLLLKMVRYLGDDDTTIAQLAEDIRVDPRMTAELLRLTNSTAFGLRSKVTRVFDAVNFLGVRRTVALILSANVVHSQQALMKSLPEDLQRWYHARSVLIGSTASAFASHLEQISPETAYVTGLLQELGIVVLAQTYGERYVQMLERTRKIPQLRLEICEQETFTFTHADVSAAVLQRWELPESLVSMVLEHHRPPDRKQKSEVEVRFSHVSQIGESLANLVDLRCPQRHVVLAHLLERYGEDNASLCKRCLTEAVAKTSESTKLLSMPELDSRDLERVLRELTDENMPDEAKSFCQNAVLGLQQLDLDLDRAERDALPEQNAAERAWRVLVIDDEPAIVRMIAHMLRPAGISVESCDNSETALEMAHQTDLVFCDINLGEESGVDVLGALRNHGYLGPCIMVTGDRRRSTVEECVRLQITDYLLKPFDRTRLLRAVNKAIHTHSPSSDLARV